MGTLRRSSPEILMQFSKKIRESFTPRPLDPARGRLLPSSSKIASPSRYRFSKMPDNSSSLKEKGKRRFLRRSSRRTKTLWNTPHMRSSLRAKRCGSRGFEGLHSSLMGVREKLGLQFMFLLILAGSVVYGMYGLWEDSWLQYLSPIRLLAMVPFGDIPVRFLESLLPAGGMMWVEGVVMFIVWSAVFLLLRGLYYSLRYAGDLSMWQLSLFFLLLGVGIIVALMIPVLDQIDLWKASW